MPAAPHVAHTRTMAGPVDSGPFPVCRRLQGKPSTTDVSQGLVGGTSLWLAERLFASGVGQHVGGWHQQELGDVPGQRDIQKTGRHSAGAVVTARPIVLL